MAANDHESRWGTDGYPAPELRVSDADRERVVDLLGRHAAEGRLTADELDARIDEAYAARTGRELERALRELPVERAGPAPETTPRRRVRPALPVLALLAAAIVAVAVASEGEGLWLVGVLAFVWLKAGRWGPWGHHGHRGPGPRRTPRPERLCRGCG